MGAKVQRSVDWQALTDVSKKLVISIFRVVQEDYPEDES
jgi:hypothetical protein